MIAKIDAAIQRYQSLINSEKLEQQEYTYYASTIDKLEAQKIELLNKQTPQGRRLQVA